MQKKIMIPARTMRASHGPSVYMSSVVILLAATDADTGVCIVRVLAPVEPLIALLMACWASGVMKALEKIHGESEHLRKKILNWLYSRTTITSQV